MKSIFERWFFFPIFLNDAEKTRRARLLVLLIPFISVWMGVLIFLLSPFDVGWKVLLFVLGLALQLGWYYVLLRGREAEAGLTMAQLELARVLSTSDTEEEAWARCLQIVLQITGMDSGGIYLINGEIGTLELVQHLGLGEEFITNTRSYPLDSASVKTILLGRPVFLDSAVIAQQEFMRCEGLVFIASLPVAYQGRVLGCINVASHVTPQFTPFARRALEVISAEIGNIAIFFKNKSALRQSERNWHTILNAVDDLVVMVDPRGRLVAANETLSRYLQKPVEELAGIEMVEFLRPDVVELRKKNLEKVLTERRMVRVVEEMDNIWRENSLYPIFGDDGQVHRVVIYSRNINEQKRYEEALRTSEEKYRGLMESLDNVVISIDRDGVLLFANDYVVRVFGQAADVMIGRHVRDLLPPAMAGFMMAQVEDVIQSDRRVVIQFLADFLSPPRWYDLTIQPVHGPDGTVSQVLLNARDIHELKTAQQELLELNRTLEERVRERTLEALDLYDNAPVGYYSLDVEGRILQANHTFVTWLGYALDDVLGRPLPGFLSAGSRSLFAQNFLLFKQQGFINNLETEFCRKDGSVFPVLLNSLAVFDEHAQFSMSRAVITDITERKKASDELRASELRFRSLFEQTHDAVLMLDLQGHTQFANSRAVEMIGYSLDELRNLSPDAITNTPDEFPHMFALLMSSGSTPRYETVARCKDGSLLPVEMNVDVIHYQTGQPSHIQMVIRDISLRKQAEETMQRAMRMKDEFLASMSHELRTPLTGILGLSEALQMQIYGTLSEKQLKALVNIEQSGRHLLDLINDILDLSKLESGKFQPQFELLSLGQACRASLQMVKGMAHKKKQQITFEMDDEQITLYADSRRVKQMLVNLLSNAVKFTPEGGALGLQVLSNRDDESVSLVVWDHGMGIKPEDIGRLFQPFIQLDNSLAREYAGTGLGLALVRELARHHGGDVSVESVVGEGSRFTIVLPWLQGLDEPVAPVTGLGFARVDGAPVLDGPGQGVVMVVEDNPLNASYITDYLISRNFRAVPVPDGRTFLEKVTQVNPDLVLMDIQMPGIDGMETIRLLRANANAQVASIPVIAVTALVMPGDRERCLQAGANDYLSKPFQMERLLEMIRGLLAEGG